MKSSIPVNIVSTIANWESRPKYILIIFQTEQYKIQINKIKNSFFKRKPKIFKQKKQKVKEMQYYNVLNLFNKGRN